ncbi:MAG: shikimate dehydrogenase family protein [Gaiellaceae bacterium]|jgi:shikimate dehydrogenase
MAISSRTRLVALLGHPVAHSLSPRMQNAAFAARGLDWAYVALDVPPERLEEALRGLAAAGFAGANVTAPHKLAAARLCDEADAQSVNTLVFEDGRIVGISTDAAVLDTSEGPSLGRVAIVGDGGAAQAFVAAVPGARVFSRRSDWPPDVRDADLVVHATPVKDDVLFELRKGQTLVDLPYPDSATAAAARSAGATVIDGLEVLVRQGAASFERWTGAPAPLDVMRNAVRSAQ